MINTNISVVGYSSGKTSLIAQILIENHGISHFAGKLAQFESQFGYKSLACIVDKLRNEIEQRRTFTVKPIKVVINGITCCIIDTPSPNTCLREALAGMFLGEAIILVVDINRFEEFQKKNMQLIMAAYGFGISRFIIALNHIVSYDKSTFNKYSSYYYKATEEFGIKAYSVSVIMINTETADNIFAPKTAEFPCLFNALKDIEQPIYKDAIPRMVIKRSEKIGGVGTVICGKMVSGKLKKGMTIDFHSGIITEIKGIENFNTQIAEVAWPSLCALNIKNVAVKDVGSFDVVGLTKDPLKFIESAVLRVQLLNSPILVCGFGLTVYCGTNSCFAHISKFIKSINRKTGEEEQEPIFVGKNECVELEIQPAKLFVMDPYDICAKLGRVLLYNINTLIGIARVLKTVKRK